MDKVTRILFLYRSLMQGAVIFKSTSCVNFDISPRSFDRDIQDIRLFLSESFSNMELVFDDERQGYHIIVTTVEKRYKGHHQKKGLREGFFSRNASARPRNFQWD